MAVTVTSHASKVLAVELRYGELSAWPYSDGVKIFLTISVGNKRQTTVLLAVQAALSKFVGKNLPLERLGFVNFNDQSLRLSQMLYFQFCFVRVFQVGCSRVVTLLSLIMPLRQRADLLDDSSVHIEVKAFKLASTHFEALEQRPPLERLLSGHFLTI